MALSPMPKSRAKKSCKKKLDDIKKSDGVHNVKQDCVTIPTETLAEIDDQQTSQDSPTANEQDFDALGSAPLNIFEELWFRYLDDVPFQSRKTINDFSGRLLGLNTAVVSAYVATLRFMEHGIKPYLFIPPLIFFGSILFSALSIFPIRMKKKYTQAEAIKSDYLRQTRYKAYTAYCSFFLFFIGLISSVVILLYF